MMWTDSAMMGKIQCHDGGRYSAMMGADAVP